MDALAAAAIQSVLTFALILCLKFKPLGLRTPEALLESLHKSKTSAAAKSHSAFFEVRAPFSWRVCLAALKAKNEVLRFSRD
jgi:hypothetical protein